jgi:peptide subunit release factor 1 (eRF1)
MKIIIKESQYKRVLLKEDYPGTKKFMGSNGVDEEIFGEILKLMKTTYSGETGFVQTATEVESDKKRGVKTKQQKDTIASAINLMDSNCKKTNQQFNKQFVSFCKQIKEILYSDNDNIFSYSY